MEDRALAARIRAAGPVNSYAGFDAGYEANMARLEAHEAKKKKKKADEEDKRQRLRHKRARRDVEDAAVYKSVMSKLKGRTPIIGDISSSDLVCLCRYLSLKPIPTGGKVNKPERFAAFLENYASSDHSLVCVCCVSVCVYVCTFVCLFVRSCVRVCVCVCVRAMCF